MKKSGFGSPLLFSALSLIGALLIASGYLYTAFTLTIGAPPTRSELEKKGITGKQLEDTLRDENVKNLEKYLPKDETDKIKNQEADAAAKNRVGNVLTEVQACITTKTYSNPPIPANQIYNTQGGCADYKELLAGIDEPKPVLTTDAANTLICVWTKGGSINTNTWVIAATKNAKVVLEDGSEAEIVPQSNKSYNLSSNPSSCKS